MSFTKQASLLGDIDNLLSAFGTEQKTAEANTEAGGYQGSTTHPVKDEDDSTQDAQEGARSSENHTDVKEDQGAPGVDNTTEGFPGGQDKVQMDVGVTSKATGEDSANEDDFKDTKDDDGHKEKTTHPAATDNEALDGHKYSSFREQLKAAEDSGAAYLATLTMEAQGEQKKVAQELQDQKSADTASYPEDKQADDASQAGYDLAGVLESVDCSVEDKQATDIMVYDMTVTTLETADRRAEKLASYYQGLSEASMKAGEGEYEEEDPSNPTEGSSEDDNGDAAAAEGADAAMTADEGGGPPPEAGGGEAELASLLAGGQGMGAEDAAGDMMGVPDAGGGDPLAGGGDPLVGGGMPPEGGGEEDLLAALAGGGDPMGGGMPPEGGGDPMGGGMPPEGGGMPPEGGGAPMGGGMPPADPMAGGGMPPEGGGMPPEGGGMPPEGGGMPGGLDDPQVLQMVLQQLGITPEMLQAAIAGKAASSLIEAKEVGTLKDNFKPKTAMDQKRINVMTGVVKEIMKNV